MEVEKRAIQLTVISATDLKRVKKFGKVQSCFAVAYIYPSQKQASHIDRNGGINPTWNSNLTLVCDESLLRQPNADASLITVEILCDGFLGKTKLVGKVSIPLRAIFSEGQCMAFQVCKRSGKPRGVLNLSIKLGEKQPLGQHETPSAPPIAWYSTSSTSYAGTSTQGNPATKHHNPVGSSVRSSTYNQEPAVVGIYPPNNQNYSTATSSGKPASTSEEPVMGYPAFAPLGPRYNPYVQQQQARISRKERRRRATHSRARRVKRSTVAKTMVIIGASLLAILII